MLVTTVLRLSVSLCMGCIVAKRCFLQQNLLLTAVSSIWEIDWYQNEWPWPLFSGRLRACQPLHYIWRWISRKPLEIGDSVPKNYQWHMEYQMVTWPMTSRDPKRSNLWPQYAWSTTYLNNSLRNYLATIANHYLVCREAVRLTILVIAWLLVLFTTTLQRFYKVPHFYPFATFASILLRRPSVQLFQSRWLLMRHGINIQAVSWH